MKVSSHSLQLLRTQKSVTTMASTSLIQFAAWVAIALWPSVRAAPASPLGLKTREGGVGVLDISIPPNRKDDRYYTVSSTFRVTQ